MLRQRRCATVGAPAAPALLANQKKTASVPTGLLAYFEEDRRPSLPCPPLQVNQKNVHGQTPLMLACRAGAADCVRLLLEAGADATLFDDLQQRTCLHYAGGWGLQGRQARGVQACVTAGAGWGRPACTMPAGAPGSWARACVTAGLGGLSLGAGRGHALLQCWPAACPLLPLGIMKTAPHHFGLHPAAPAQPYTAGQRRSMLCWKTSRCSAPARPSSSSSSSWCGSGMRTFLTARATTGE